MARNEDTAIARQFHGRTSHTPASIRLNTHALDWDIKPYPFKVYVDVPTIQLPRALDPVVADTLAALRAPATPAGAPVTLDTLTTLLYYTAGVTKKKTYPGGGEVLFRAAASTGALYQTEVYVVAGDVENLPAGLYHFCPGDFTLRRLRDGDVRAALAAAAADDALARRAATVILSAIYWRNTWKYQARAWRHLYWDSGTMLANLLAVARALDQAPRLHAGFVDAEVNRLLGLDATREAALELVAIGYEGAAAAPAERLPEIRHETLPLSSDEVDYPALREMQEASSLASADAVRAWRRATAPAPRPPRGEVTPLPPPRERAGRSLTDTIQRRGSTRRFSHTPLSAVELSTVLFTATRGFDADVPRGLADLYLIVNAVDGVAPGAYCHAPESNGLERLSQGSYRRESAYLCLEQPLGGDAAAVIYFLAPLEAIVRAFGNRGYRLANLEAGLVGGGAYLAAYAQGFGASGLTFYDRQVVDFFSPHAAGKDALFVTTLGRAAGRDADELPNVRWSR